MKGLKKYSVLMTVSKDIELTIWAKDEDAANRWGQRTQQAVRFNKQWR